MRIGTFEFPAATLVQEKTEFVLGRVRRILTLVGVLDRFSSRETYHAALVGLEREVERFDRGETDLSVRTGRSLRGRRRKWSLLREEDLCLAVFSLEVLAEDRFERSEAETVRLFAIEDSPTLMEVEPLGNWPALPVLELTALSALSKPVFGDGTRSLLIDVDLDPGDVLRVDGEKRTVTLNDTLNLLGRTAGEFPELSPGTAVLQYTDDTLGGRIANLRITWRDRWV